MEAESGVDPMLLEVWRHLLSRYPDPVATTQFFEHHVIDGARVLQDIHRHHLAALLNEAPTGATLSTPEPESESRPKTQYNLERHREIIERKWLVTGYVAVLRQVGHMARRIPLNYRRILIGPPDMHADIALDFPDSSGIGYRACLELVEGRFVIHHEAGRVQTHLNGTPVEQAAVDNGDRLQIGPFELAVFKLLESTAEITIVSEPGAGERFLIDISELRMGRPGKRANDINLPSPTVSREHAVLKVHENKFWLVPETASSPTVVNGVPIKTPRVLLDNDQVVLGEQALLFRIRGEAARPRTLQARIATVLFSDLRGWTSLAEATPLEELVLQVNEYYKAMGDVIHRYGGTVMTYQGDALMAVFGAPSTHADDPWRAVASALRMIEVRNALNHKWRSENKAELTGGIGIHTGQVMVGELGHSSRLEYSAMGDATNLAARLEQLTKEYKCPLIISDATYTEVAPLVEARSLGTVTVKGRTAPTVIYHVTAVRNV